MLRSIATTAATLLFVLPMQANANTLVVAEDHYAGVRLLCEEEERNVWLCLYSSETTPADFAILNTEGVVSMLELMSGPNTDVTYTSTATPVNTTTSSER